MMGKFILHMELKLPLAIVAKGFDQYYYAFWQLDVTFKEVIQIGQT
jgi:hypothetical protein